MCGQPNCTFDQKTHQSTGVLIYKYRFSSSRVLKKWGARTKIRQLIENGEIGKANHYLGYAFSLFGKVIKGNSLGKTIGFPTANIEVKDKWKLHPADGVYAVKIIVKDTEYIGMMNIGKKCTRKV